MTNLDSILQSRDITLPTKVCLVKAMVFLVVMYGCESWTKRKLSTEELMLFELWCWRRLLRVPWTARRSNQSFLKETSPEYSLEGLMLKLKPWCWERLKAGGEGDDRGWDGWMASPTQWTRVWISSGNWWRTGKPGVLQSMGLQRVRHDWATELNWTGVTMSVWDGSVCSDGHLKPGLGTSLLVQWLRLHAAHAGGLGSIPGQGTRSHMLQPRPGTAK